jgi:hypothetical protein
VTVPDFEIDVGLRARALISHVPPAVETLTEGEDVTATRAETRDGLPASMEPGGCYEWMIVEKRLVASIAPEPQAQATARRRVAVSGRPRAETGSSQRSKADRRTDRDG